MIMTTYTGDYLYTYEKAFKQSLENEWTYQSSVVNAVPPKYSMIALELPNDYIRFESTLEYTLFRYFETKLRLKIGTMDNILGLNYTIAQRYRDIWKAIYHNTIKRLKPIDCNFNKDSHVEYIICAVENIMARIIELTKEERDTMYEERNGQYYLRAFRAI